MNGIVWNGMILARPGLEVMDGRANGLWWNPWSKGARHRVGAIRGIVWHHTGGEGGAERIFKTLSEGRVNDSGNPISLSVHFTVGPDGRITQHADPATTVCLHAGTANGWSVGVEVASAGIAPPRKGTPREVYEDSCHGRAIRYLRFTPKQLAACKALSGALLMATGLPNNWPVDAGAVLRRALPRAKVAAWKGQLGHLHISKEKIDPSPHLMDFLALS